MIRAIHVEDEPHNLALLKKLLDKHCSETIMLVGQAKNKIDAISLIKLEKPQLLFLDVELQTGNSFELIEELKDYDLEIIFITAYAKYAVEAFRVNAVDYLLKPISTKSLVECIAKAVEKINSKNASAVLKSGLLISENGEKEKRVGFPTRTGTVFLQVKDIISIEASGSYSILQIMESKKLTTSKNLKQIEEAFTKEAFVRVHHSWSVNMNHVQRYLPGKKGFVEMKDGSRIPVSIRRKGIFLNKL